MIFGAGLYSMTPSDLFFFRKQGSVSFAQNVYTRQDSETCLELLSILLNIFHKAQCSKSLTLTWWLCRQVFHN